MILRYLAYLRDNPERYWFKRKIWGWGWVPATWQGWAVTLGYLVLIVLLALTQEPSVPGDPDSGSNPLVFGLPIALLTAFFIVIAYKTGERPRWQWGLSDD